MKSDDSETGWEDSNCRNFSELGTVLFWLVLTKKIRRYKISFYDEALGML